MSDKNQEEQNSSNGVSRSYQQVVRPLKTVDELLVENENLHNAVSILINSCIKNDRSALIKWDQFRKQEAA